MLPGQQNSMSPFQISSRHSIFHLFSEGEDVAIHVSLTDTSQWDFHSLWGHDYNFTLNYSEK